MEWYLEPLRKYASFSGRARRREYWTFSLVNTVISGVFTSISNAMDNPFFLTLLMGIFSMAIFIPGLAVAVRRLHDIGKSGTWILIVLIPLVGWIFWLIYTLRDSDYGNNKYGPNPKGEG